LASAIASGGQYEERQRGEQPFVHQVRLVYGHLRADAADAEFGAGLVYFAAQMLRERKRMRIGRAHKRRGVMPFAWRAFRVDGVNTHVDHRRDRFAQIPIVSVANRTYRSKQQTGAHPDTCTPASSGCGP